MPPLQGKSMIVLNEADIAKYQQNEVEPRELLSSSRKSLGREFFYALTPYVRAIAKNRWLVGQTQRVPNLLRPLR